MHHPKDIDWLVGENMRTYALTLTISLYLISPNCMQFFYIVNLVMFPLMLMTVIIFGGGRSGYWLWKLINIFYCCDYVTITQYHCIMIGQQKNNRTLLSPKLGSNRKTCNHFIKSRCISELSWNFLGGKKKCSGIAFFLQSSRYVSMSSHV